MNLEQALLSFEGYLKGTEAPMNTKKSYMRDLHAFREYIYRSRGNGNSQNFKLSELRKEDLERYRETLSKSGNGISTRRRKLLTLRKFLRYLQGRKKITVDFSDQIPAPLKNEKIPPYFFIDEVQKKLLKYEVNTEIRRRNLLLAQLILETGCLVSELIELQWDDVDQKEITLGKKEKRIVEISEVLFLDLMNWKKNQKNKNEDYLFSGYNRFGRFTKKMSARGLEQSFEEMGKELGLSDFTGRTLRHTAVMHWLLQGEEREKVQKKLGLKSMYAFKVYDGIFKRLTNQSQAE